MSSASVAGHMTTQLPPAVLQLLRRFGEFAQTQKTQAYLIGGVVRDLLQQRGSTDIDVMVETECAPFVKCLYSVWPQQFAEFPSVRKPILFKRYKTAKLDFSAALAGEVHRIDFSSARAEQYAAPAAVPEISSGTLAQDLARRDFSVNAMAVALNPATFGTLIDQHEGSQDLEQRVLRILHNKSFVDDPARLIRGIRFAVRLGFCFEPRTAELFADAARAEYLSRLAPGRLYDEFRKALAENLPEVLVQLETAGLLVQIAPALKGFDRSRLERLHGAARPAQTPVPGSSSMLALLAAVAGPETVSQTMQRFGRPAEEIATVLKLSHAYDSLK